MEELVGGRYRLEDRVGGGGMADVWRATDVRTGATVALKRLHAGLRGDPATLARFGREVETARQVAHPRLVGILDALVGEDDAWLAMPFVPGGSLADRLARGPLNEATAAAIGADVADALTALHRAGIVHRDVTPGNVLLDANGRALLGDLGIARAGGDDALAVTATGDLVGTFRFMAPEQLAGGDATPASDAWALGAVLYEAIAGSPPFDVTSPAALVASQRTPAPPLPTQDRAIASLLARLLDADPVRRPDTAEAAATLHAAAPLPDPADDRTVVIGAAALGAVASASRAADPARAAGAAPAADAARASGPVPAGHPGPRPAPAVSAAQPTVGRPPASDHRRLAAVALLAIVLLVGLVAATGATRDTRTEAVDATPITTTSDSAAATPTADPTQAPADGGGGGGGNGKDKGGKPDNPGKAKGNGNGRGG